MNQENKIKLSRQIIMVSGAFCVLVALLLSFNFWNMKTNEPLESEAIDVLLERFSGESENEALKTEIRNFDLLARKAYFTSIWQVNTGAALLLIGAIIFAISLKVYTDLKNKIERPENSNENPFIDNQQSFRWLLTFGLILFGLGMIAVVFTNDYLKAYSTTQTATLHTTIPENEPVEVISIHENTAAPQADSVNEIHEDTVSNPSPVPEERITEETLESKPEPEKEIFNPEDYKKYQSTFRGYLGQGISYHKNIPTDWDGATGKNIKWKVALTKHGYNTPVIWKDKIFVAGGDKQSRIVSCFDRHTGRLLWENVVDNIPGSPATPPKVTDDTGLSAPTMTIDGSRVIAIFATGDLIAFDFEGNRVWAKNLGVPSNHYGHSSSLIVWKGILVVQYDTSKGGRMLGINSKNGEFIWDIKRDNNISWSSPMLIEQNGKMQIITSSDPDVAAYELETGQLIWKVPEMMGEVAPSPATYNNLVYATNEYAKTVAVNSKGEIVWENDDYLSEVSSPVAANGLLFLATSYGTLVCYDAMTGENLWEKNFDNGFYSSPMIAEGRLYIIDMQGIMHIIKVDRSGTIISQPELGEAAFSLPAFADGNIYLRSNSSLYCIEKE